jgi:hypothetical protein
MPRDGQAGDRSSLWRVSGRTRPEANPDPLSDWQAPEIRAQMVWRKV